MYHGEVNVAQEELNSFLAVAEDLKVKGLTQNGTSKSQPLPPPPSPFQRPPPPSPQPRKERPRVPQQHQQQQQPHPQESHDTQNSHHVVEVEDITPVKAEPLSLATQPTPSHSDMGDVNPSMYMEEYGTYEESYEDRSEEGYDDGSMTQSAANADGNKEHVLDLDLDEKIERNMNRIVGENGEGVFYSCGVCQGTYKDKTKMKHHIETHLDSYQICPICQQHCKTRRTLKTHMARAHSNFDTSFDEGQPEAAPEVKVMISHT